MRAVSFRVFSRSLLNGAHAHAHADQPRQEISVTLKDGSERKGMSWETSPMDIAKQISQGLADRAVIAKVSHRDCVRRGLAAVVIPERTSHVCAGFPRVTSGMFSPFFFFRRVYLA